MRTELHGFSDASELCYAACLYFKFVKSNGDMQISLVTAKSRLVPKRKEKNSSEKKYTVPRLELMGNFLLSKLVVSGLEAVREEIQIDEIYCWTDSMISLAWINARDKEFRTFVQNRVIGIRRNVKEEHWRHCRSEENAVDVLTKDKKAVDFNSWLRGPEFLYSSELSAEKSDRVHNHLQPAGFVDEIKQAKSSSLHTRQASNYFPSGAIAIDIQRYNDLDKLLHVTAFVI